MCTTVYFNNDSREFDLFVSVECVSYRSNLKLDPIPPVPPETTFQVSSQSLKDNSSPSYDTSIPGYPHVAFSTPRGRPRIFNQPVILASRSTVANDMVECLRFPTRVFVNSVGIKHGRPFHKQASPLPVHVNRRFCVIAPCQ